MKLFKKRVKFWFLLLSSLFVLTTTNKSFLKFEAKATTKKETTKKEATKKEIDNTKIGKAKKQLERVESSKKTTDGFVLDLIRKNKTDDEIVEIYYSTPDEVVAALIKNDRFYKVKEKKEVIASDKEKERIEKILKKIKKKEAEFFKEYMKFPKKKNKDNPIVVINPGHGFEDPGCVILNPNYKKGKTNYKKNKTEKQKNLGIEKIDASLDNNNKEIYEKIFNQLLAYELVLELLDGGYEVYLVFDFVDLFERFNLRLPKENPSLHILFNTRPPVKGYGDPPPCRIADASAFCISEIFKSLNKHYKKEYKTTPKMCSICIHHDVNPNKKEKEHGFVPFYRKPDRITSEELSKNSEKFAKIMLNYCKNVNKMEKGKNISRVATEEWVVCGPGKEIKNAAALLVEIGRVDDSDELKLILKPSKRNEMAKAMKKAIVKYFKK